MCTWASWRRRSYATQVRGARSAAPNSFAHSHTNPFLPLIADAAEHYERAWKFEGEMSATIGYKLTFNYLKAGRATAAIDVAKKVLAAYPQYPMEELLRQARALVRVPRL